MTIFNNKMYTIILLIVIILSLLILGFWILIPFFLENPKYTILEKNNHFQIRKYDEMTIAKITTVGERYEGLRKGFIHIFGGILAVNIVTTTKIMVNTFAVGQ